MASFLFCFLSYNCGTISLSKVAASLFRILKPKPKNNNNNKITDNFENGVAQWQSNI